MIKLESWVQGSWQGGKGGARTLHDPSTGEAIAEVSSEGIDFAGAVEHAREVGGPALRALGFARRGELLKELWNTGSLYTSEELALPHRIRRGPFLPAPVLPILPLLRGGWGPAGADRAR